MHSLSCAVSERAGAHELLPMDMQTRSPPLKDSRKQKRRDKVGMAWRHKSRSEKNLIKVIAFLSFALLCFIIAVIAMDLGYKSKIQSLEDEIHDLQSPETSESTAAINTTDTEGPNYNTTIETSFTSTVSPDTTASVSTVVSESSTATTGESTTSETTTDTSSTAASSSTSTPGTGPPTEALFESLRAMLKNFSGMKTSTNKIEKVSHRGSFTSRSRGTFIIMADIDQEETRSIISAPTVTSDPILYIDGSEISSTTPPTGESARNSTSDAFEDMEDDSETTPMDEGSGEGAPGSTASP